jgi:type IV fimbrial biogenesis protein FimT
MKMRRKCESGFSLLELVIVVVIVVIVTAMAVPNIFNIIYNIRLRSSVQTVAGMMQTCRMLAVRDNRYYFVRYAAATALTM